MRWRPVHPRGAGLDDEPQLHVECALCSELATNADSTGVEYCARHYRRVHPQRVRRLALFVVRGPSRVTVLRWERRRPHRVRLREGS